MGIFHEFFPVTRSSISAYVDSQKNAENLSNIGGGGDVGSDNSSDETLEVIRKKGLTQKVRDIVDGTHMQISQSKIIASQLSKVHRMIEKFDEINFFVEPVQGKCDVDQQRFRVAACESILSLDQRRKKEKVDSSPKPNTKPELKSTRSSTQKLLLPSKGLKKTTSMPVLASTKSLSESMSALAIPKKASRCSQKLPSPSVQQILKAAKDKRKSNQNEIKIPVVELKFCK